MLRGQKKDADNSLNDKSLLRKQRQADAFQIQRIPADKTLTYRLILYICSHLIEFGENGCLPGQRQTEFQLPEKFPL